MTFNKVIYGGNLTRDPELRYTPKGTAICVISIAANRRFNGEDGQARDEVTYLECTAWGKTAELIGANFKKGRPILIEGRLKLDQWDDKQTGQKRSKLMAVVETFTFVDKREDGPGGGSPPPEDVDVPF